jgi:hypothetical protein
VKGPVLPVDVVEEVRRLVDEVQATESSFVTTVCSPRGTGQTAVNARVLDVLAPKLGDVTP